MKFLPVFVAIAAVSTTPYKASAETRTLKALLSNENVVAGGAAGSTSTSHGVADFVLTWDPADAENATLSYDITVSADLDGTQTPDINDDVTAIHFHDINVCASATCLPGDTAGTLHVLNAYGVPRHDDADMQSFPSSGLVSGYWDASDANDLTPAASVAPGDVLDQILNGETFVMVHTREFPSGAFGGLIVPEPTSLGMSLMAGLWCLPAIRRRRQSK